MVVLDRIYTGGGDGGLTSLGNGQRVSKLHPRIVAGGSIDELNCAVGVAVAAAPESALTPLLRQLQQFLFDLGADLCVPLATTHSAASQSSADPPVPAGNPDTSCPRITAEHVRQLEQLIDQQTAVLQPLRSFILPGGSGLAAALHAARAVCRRAELDCLRLNESESVNQQLLIALNRLSDLLFVLARVANDNGRLDVLWEPGRSL